MKEINVEVDLMANGKASGEVANYLQAKQIFSLGSKKPFLHTNGKSYITKYNGGDPKDAKSFSVEEVNTNAAVLRRDEWKALDTALMEISRQRLGGVDDLIEKGLTYNLGNAMGTTVLEWHDISDFGDADMTMDGVTRAKNDRPNFQHNYLPIPIIHADYEINERFLNASRALGNPVDTTYAERAARKVREKIERLLFTDVSYSYGEQDSRSRNSIYSYINFPDRNVAALGTPWTSLTQNVGATIVAQVNNAKQKAMNSHFYGPYMLYIPKDYETLIDMDYDTTRGNTIRQRILAISGIMGIKTIDYLPANNVLLVQMTSDVVRLVRGLPLQTIQWASEGGFVNNFKVITIQVPQIRSDQNGNCGIVHLA